MNVWQGGVRHDSSLGSPVFLLSGAMTLLIACLEICMASEEKPATNMRDIDADFRDCLQPFHEADGSQIMLYFSVKRNGQQFRRPASGMVWIRCWALWIEERILSDFVPSYESCMPLRLNNLMAEAIPGKVYYLQFNGGREGSQVIVKPFGRRHPPHPRRPLMTIVGEPPQLNARPLNE